MSVGRAVLGAGSQVVCKRAPELAFLRWALRVSNPRPSRCKSETTVQQHERPTLACHVVADPDAVVRDLRHEATSQQEPNGRFRSAPGVAPSHVRAFCGCSRTQKVVTWLVVPVSVGMDLVKPTWAQVPWTYEGIDSCSGLASLATQAPTPVCHRELQELPNVQRLIARRDA